MGKVHCGLNLHGKQNHVVKICHLTWEYLRGGIVYTRPTVPMFTNIFSVHDIPKELIMTATLNSVYKCEGSTLVPHVVPRSASLTL